MLKHHASRHLRLDPERHCKQQRWEELAMHSKQHHTYHTIVPSLRRRFSLVDPAPILDIRIRVFGTHGFVTLIPALLDVSLVDVDGFVDFAGKRILVFHAGTG